MEKTERTVEIRLPQDYVDLLGDDPARETLERGLLSLIQEERISVGRAGEILGLDKRSAIEWYTSHGYRYPDLSAEDLEADFQYAERFRG